MPEIKIASQKQIEEIKKLYKKWIKGKSLPEGHEGQDYVLDRANHFLNSEMCQCWDGNFTELSNSITDLLNHKIALQELLDNNDLDDLEEESKKVLYGLMDKADEFIELIDLSSVDRTRQKMRRKFLGDCKKPEKKIDVNRKALTEQDLKRQEQIWSLVKGMQPKKIRDKADKIIYNVALNSASLTYSEDEKEKRTARRKLRKAVVDAFEAKKMISWWLSKHGKHAYPLVKQWLEARLLLLDYIVQEYVLQA